MKKILSILALLVITLQGANAQCVMCKAAVESSSKMDAYTNGINNGILYMAVFPYLLIGTIGFLLYKKYKKQEKEKLEAKKERRQMKMDMMENRVS